ncbi:MAG: transcriptional regulator NrdR [Myxococcota bacterium]
MKCPACHHVDSKVVDSRDAGDAIRRRRSCLACGHRFTTLERLEVRLPMVVKRDGRREPFSRDKVLHGIALACRKRPIDADRREAAVLQVEAALVELREAEVRSSAVGEIVMRVLEELDAVAYVRFASVYRQFESVEQFAAFLPVIPPTTDPDGAGG